MTDEAVILVGGRGTRLQSVIRDIPKPMAPVAGKPFLCYILNNLQKYGITKVVLATGHLHDVIFRYFGDKYENISICYSREEEPLFTGGAIQQATKLISGDDFFVLNGDTFFDVRLSEFVSFHLAHSRPLSLVLRQVDNVGRYGKVEIEGDVVINFLEKNENAGQGLINGGIYLINKTWLQNQKLPKMFSFEKEVLEKVCYRRMISGMVCNNFFLDIGIPEDYQKAKQAFIKDLSKDEILFLDRDGVINELIEGDYVRKWEQFRFIDGAVDSLKILRERFRKIFVVSNQQGVSKGLFSSTELDAITKKMSAILDSHDAHIDKVYYCTDLENAGSKFRKPEIGMVQQAIDEYPCVQLSRSVMIGDSETDMQMGYRTHMRCIFLTNNKPIPQGISNYTDMIFPNLFTFIQSVPF